MQRFRTERGPSPRVLVLAAHCVLSGPARPSLLLEDTVGRMVEHIDLAGRRLGLVKAF